MPKFEDSLLGALTQQQPMPGQTTEPVRSPSSDSDVAVPIKNATFTAALVAVVEATVGLVVFRDFRADYLLVIVVVSFAVVAGTLHQIYFKQARESMWKREVRLGVDIDGDGRVGAHLAVTNASGPERAEDAAQQKRRRLLEFVEVVYEVNRPSSRTLTAKGFSETEVAEFRDVLIQLGVAAWNNPKFPTAGFQMVVPPGEARRKAEQSVIALPDRWRS